MAKIAEFSPVNYQQHKMTAEFETKRFEYLVQRRHQLVDKIRFGVLTLNGASILALLAALGGSGNTAKWLGFTEGIALQSASAFAFGTVCAGIAIMIDANQFKEEAGIASSRQIKAQILASQYESDYTEENHTTLGRVMKEFHDEELIDFNYSSYAIIAQNVSAGSWLCGILLPLFSAICRSSM